MQSISSVRCFMYAIETDGLTRVFEQRVAVDRLTLAIPPGKVFGFLGPNGAGKTTTVRMLTALIAPSSGTAVINGRRLGIGDDTENIEIRRSVGILTESPGLYDRLTAWQNLVFFAQLHSLPTQRAHAQAEHYLRMLDLWERRDERVGGFSKGMRQKLAIARALMHEPEIVFLDEPTSGLDPEAARLVRDFIKTLRGEGRTIFLTTHNLPEADELCDLIGVFKTRLIHVDTPENLRANLFGRGTKVHVIDDAERWIDVVRVLPFVKQVSANQNLLSVALDDPDAQNPALVTALVQAGAQIRTVTPIEHSLEDVYLEVLGDDQERASVAKKASIA
jgi:ABC-2 type transport system ATP-binding protein